VPRFGFALFALAGVAIEAHAACEAEPVMQLPDSAVRAEASAGMALGVHPGLAGWRKVLVRVDALPLLGHDLQPECGQALMAVVAEIAAPASDYVKQTEFDNTPYRFNMIQDGKRMSADDFDAWLRANGYSVGRRVNADSAQD